MRLGSQKRKQTIVVVSIVIAIVLVLALVIGGIVLLSNPALNAEKVEPDTIIGIELSARPSKLEYVVGESFMPDGARVFVSTHSYDKSYFVDHSKVQFSGFDSSSVGEQVITVTYKGFTTTFTITVKEPSDDGQGENQSGIEVCDFKTEYTVERWNQRSPSTYGSYVKITRPDGTVYGSPNDTPLTGNNIFGYETVEGPCEFELTIIYFDKDGTEYNTTVTITITE